MTSSKAGSQRRSKFKRVHFTPGEVEDIIRSYIRDCEYGAEEVQASVEYHTDREDSVTFDGYNVTYYTDEED